MENITSHNYINMRTRCGPCINHSVFNIQIPCAATGYTKHYFAGTKRLASAIGNGGLADIGDLKSPYSPPANCKFAGTGTAIIKAAKLTPSARSSYPEGNVHHLKK